MEILLFSTLQGKKAQEERVRKLNQWIDNTSLQYYCLSSSEADFKVIDEILLSFRVTH